MIAAWMAYAMVIAALISVAALLAERIAILRRLPSRWVWMAALLSSLFLPMLLAWNSGRVDERPAAALVALAARKPPPAYARSPLAWVGGESVTVARRVAWDAWLLTGWSVMSALALATLVMGWIQLRRRLRSAVQDEIAGASVTVSEDVGPAVVGIVQPRIVVPRWLQQQDAQTQALVLAHEREHLRAHDVRVLGGAFLVAVLLPW
ncbi:MAG TPA: M56 family metallopeptidase, partial [Steroidobacteraceae bacterium]|nr:M56 family metallopeptidase [Steroidobacteraceae bacterium]